ncbi:MAG: hydroxymethylglutaryl-CoA synthase [Candidatus Rickettsia vulgarisii]
MDFWRPNYLVDGKFSTEMYFHALEETWRHYQTQSNRQFQDHDFYCYHTPIPRLVEKAHTKLVNFNQVNLSEQQIKQQVLPALNYSNPDYG